MRTPLRSFAIFALGCVVLVVIVIACYRANQIIPYSLSHFRQIKAVELASRIQAWQSARVTPDLRDLEVTNSRKKVFVYQTNIVFRGTSYGTLVALEDDSFRNKGILVATTNLDIFWLGRGGQLELELRATQSTQ